MWKAVRILIGLALVARGLELLMGVARSGDGHMGVLGSALFAFAVMIVGAIVLAPSLAAWAAIPFTRFIDGIYLPGGPTGDDPEPNYLLADHYHEIGQNRLAIDEYEKIIRYHPDETRAYIALIDLWARCGDAHRAAKIYRRGLRKSRSREARHELRDAYRTCRDLQGHSETEEGTLC